MDGPLKVCKLRWRRCYVVFSTLPGPSYEGGGPYIPQDMFVGKLERFIDLRKLPLASFGSGHLKGGQARRGLNVRMVEKDPCHVDERLKHLLFFLIQPTPFPAFNQVEEEDVLWIRKGAGLTGGPWTHLASPLLTPAHLRISRTQHDTRRHHPGRRCKVAYVLCSVVVDAKCASSTEDSG